VKKIYISTALRRLLEFEQHLRDRDLPGLAQPYSFNPKSFTGARLFHPSQGFKMEYKPKRKHHISSLS
ncbi:Hypothetical protein FKW44_003911, partial [Caligus rogercresseyi]